VPCRVSVIDCSNRSSSSVSDKLRVATVLGRAILTIRMFALLLFSFDVYVQGGLLTVTRLGRRDEGRGGRAWHNAGRAFLYKVPRVSTSLSHSLPFSYTSPLHGNSGTCALPPASQPFYLST